jgi:hypothetical protein
VSCRPCQSAPHRTVRTYPAGDTRSQPRADRTAQEHRDQGHDVHVHYDPTGDAHVVCVRT